MRGAEFVHFVASAVLTGAAGFLVLFVCVTSTGQTFGQRCEVDHVRPGTAWNACVARHVKGS